MSVILPGQYAQEKRTPAKRAPKGGEEEHPYREPKMTNNSYRAGPLQVRATPRQVTLRLLVRKKIVPMQQDQGAWLERDHQDPGTHRGKDI